MHQIKIEVNGKVKAVTLDQLRMLASRKFLEPDARIWVDEKEYRFKDVASKLAPADKKNVAANSLPSAARKTEPSTAPQRVAEVPPPAPSANDQTAKSGSKLKSVLVIFLVLIFVVGIGVGGVWWFLHANGLEDNFAETYNSVKDKAKKQLAKKRTFTENDPFDRTLTRIPQNFQGNNFEKIFDKFLEQQVEIEKVLEKDEFETEDEHTERWGREVFSKERTLLGNIHFGEDVALLITRNDYVTDKKGKQWSSVALDSKYDMDSHSWSLEIHFTGKGTDHLIPLFRRKESSFYTAHNAFNAQMEIRKDDISIVGIHGVAVGDVNDVLRCVLTDVPVDVAKNATENLAALCVFQTNYYPVVRRHESSADATFDHPFEYEIDRQSLLALTIDFWFFDRKTGEIFVKVPFHELKRTPVKDFQKARKAAASESEETIPDGGKTDNDPLDVVFEPNEKETSELEYSDANEKPKTEKVPENATPSNSSSSRRTTSANPSNLTAQKNNENNVSAVNNSKTDAMSTADKSSVKYETVPFDNKADKLPPDYRGHDPAAIVRGLTTSDFSTSKISYKRDSRLYLAAVIQKATNLQDKTLFGAVRFNSRVAYVFPNESENSDNKVETVKCEYDSSNKVLTVRRSFKNSGLNASSWDSGSYPPMAVYFGLLERNSNSYALALEFNQTKKSAASQIEHWTVVGVEPEQYAKFKDTLRLACVFNIGAGGNNYVGYFRPRSGSRLFSHYLICAAAPEFWLFDSKTGEVIAKYSAADTFNGKRVKIGDTNNSK